MLHVKFQNHRPSGSGEENFYRFLLFITMAAIPAFGSGELKINANTNRQIGTDIHYYSFIHDNMPIFEEQDD